MDYGKYGDDVADFISSELESISDDVGQQIVISRIMRAIDGLRGEKRQPAPVAKDQPMTDKQAKEFEKQEMIFGKHRGSTVGEIPLSYLDWLVDSNTKFFRLLGSYLESKRAKTRRENEFE